MALATIRLLCKSDNLNEGDVRVKYGRPYPCDLPAGCLGNLAESPTYHFTPRDITTLDWEKDVELGDIFYIETIAWGVSDQPLFKVLDYTIKINYQTVYNNKGYETLISGVDPHLFYTVTEIPALPQWATYCDVFNNLRDRCYSIADEFEQITALGSKWWVIDTILDITFGKLAIFYTEMGDFFGTLHEWCITLMGGLLGGEFTFNQIEQLFNITGLWDAINHLDDWLAEKIAPYLNPILDEINGIKEFMNASLEGLEDKVISYVVDKFEYILDKVFE